MYYALFLKVQWKKIKIWDLFCYSSIIFISKWNNTNSCNLVAFILFPSSGFLLLIPLIIWLYMISSSSALNPWWKEVLVNQQIRQANWNHEWISCSSSSSVLREDRKYMVSSVQSLSRVRLFATPWTRSMPALPVHHWLLELKLMSIRSVMPSNHLILCRLLLLPPSIFPSIKVFSNESVLCIRWPKYWSFSFNISPSNEYSGLISFRIDWFDILAV